MMIKWLAFRDWNLKWKFIVIFVVLVTLPTAAFGSLVLYRSNQVLKKQAVESTERILDTLEKNLTSTVRSVEDITTYIIFSDDFRALFMLRDPEENQMQYSDLKEKVNGYLLFHFMSKPYINSMTLEGRNQVRMHFGEPVSGDEQSWIQAAETAKGGIVWSDSYPMTSGWGGTKNVVALFREINDKNHASRAIGRVTVRLNVEALYQLIAAGIPQEQGSVFVLRRNGTVVLHNNKELLGKMYPDPKFVETVVSRQDNTSFSYDANGNRYLVVTREMNEDGWFLVAMMNERAVLSELEGIRNTTRNMTAGTILLGLIALVGFYFSIIRPILELTLTTKRVELGDFSAHVQVRSQDEIGKLSLRFNKMVATIMRLIETKYKLEIKQKESEIKALQAQINPHFLYNTLDMIRWTARLEKAMETSRLIETLSRLFRLSLSQGKIWIPLRDELSYVQSYLELQQKRLGNGLQFEMIMDVGVGEYLVLKQIVQPLVENSIVHGFKGMQIPGRIRIKCHTNGQIVMIDVTDNGLGLDVNSVLSEMQTPGKAYKGGFALRNIQERLIAIFGPEFGLQLLVPDTPGTWVRLRLPILRNEDDIRNLTEGLEMRHDD